MARPVPIVLTKLLKVILMAIALCGILILVCFPFATEEKEVFEDVRSTIPTTPSDPP